MRFVVAPGGIGGLGNAALANPKRKAPGFALLGTPGWEGDVVLELKTVADVALVGYPSAGKSSLIAAISAARPKIADYPFTTLHPNLGVVQAGDVRYTVADVPGLIEGASEGKGLGLEFLRHVERCTALVHVLDCATLEPGRDPLTDLDVILAELAAYPVPEGQLPLLERPQLIALNKIDVPEAQDLAELVRPELEARGYRVFEISTVSHEGLRQLTFALGDVVAAAPRRRGGRRPCAERIVIRPQRLASPTSSSASRAAPTATSTASSARSPSAGCSRPTSRTTRPSASSPTGSRSSASRTSSFRAGAQPGSTVVIGEGDGVVFDWEPTLTSAAELMTAPRGTDPRLDRTARHTTSQRRERVLRAHGRQGRGPRRARGRAPRRQGCQRARQPAQIGQDDE